MLVVKRIVWYETGRRGKGAALGKGPRLTCDLDGKIVLQFNLGKMVFPRLANGSAGSVLLESWTATRCVSLLIVLCDVLWQVLEMWPGGIANASCNVLRMHTCCAWMVF